MNKRFITQLAQASTDMENLAHRGAATDKKRPVGAFYVEGKAGINFSNALDKQVLVRLPQADAQRVIDDVVPGGKIPADQLALQVGH